MKIRTLFSLLDCRRKDVLFAFLGQDLRTFAHTAIDHHCWIGLCRDHYWKYAGDASDYLRQRQVLSTDVLVHLAPKSQRPLHR